MLSAQHSTGTCVACARKRTNLRKKRIVNDVVTGRETGTESETGIVRGTEVSDLIAVDVPGPAARNPIFMRQIAARLLRNVSAITESPAWPRLSCPIVSLQVDTMIAKFGKETGNVTEEIGIENVTENVIVTGSVNVTAIVSATVIVNARGTGFATGTATMIARLVPAETSL